MNYHVKFTGHLDIAADSPEEAREAFWASILEMFSESQISEVLVEEAK